MPSFPLACLSLVFEALLGYSPRLVAAIGHPVIWLGRLIAALDHRLNREEATPKARRRAGRWSLAALLAAAVAPAIFLQLSLALLPLGLLIAALLGSSLFAQRSLYEHVADVARCLEFQGLASARRSVSRIVGRDPETLDASGVASAAIESLAENFSDGIVSPAVWMCLGGLPGAAAFKAVSTADSMIGHRTARYLHYGRAAARLDDAMNLPGARLSGLLLVTAAAFVPGASARNAWRSMRRDAGKHRSPNAGWPEAAMAGALGIALGGPRIYGGERVDAAFMGDGRRTLEAADIRRAVLLYQVADGLLIALLACGALVQTAVSGEILFAG